jgi:hypothetical protein
MADTARITAIGTRLQCIESPLQVAEMFHMMLLKDCSHSSEYAYLLSVLNHLISSSQAPWLADALLQSNFHHVILRHLLYEFREHITIDLLRAISESCVALLDCSWNLSASATYCCAWFQLVEKLIRYVL